MPRPYSSCIKKLLILFIVLTSPFTFAEDFTPDKRIVFKSIDNVDLSLHVFYPEGKFPNSPKSAIVFFFGGGWKQGSPEQFYQHCQHLASKGMVAISAEYRVFSRHKTSPKESVKDGKSAIRYLRQHATELGIDPTRIVAAGGSAGGQIAAACATLEAFEEAGEDYNTPSKPSALVLFNPVFDNSIDGYGYERVKDYWEDFSPLHNIDKSSPPTIIFLGTKDSFVPVATALKYKSKMEALGNRCDLLLYPEQTHGFFNYENTENYNKTVFEMDKFLNELGYFSDS